MAGTADSFLTLQQMAAAGLGRAILPCFLAETDPRLTRQDFRLPDLSVDIWVASHSDLATIPRIRAVREHLQTSPYVAKFESADVEQGGDGVTLAHLRGGAGDG